MFRRKLVAVLASLGLAAACNGSPSAPSQGSPASTVAAQAAVMSAMSQAVGQMALAGPVTGGTSNTITVPCPGGGSMVMTMNPGQLGDVYRSSSRIEFRDCRNGSITMNGDPYLDSSMEGSFASLGGGTSGTSVLKMTTTGGMRMSSNGIQGRVGFNCTTTVTMTSTGAAQPQVSISSSGTMTFEQPLGSTPVTRPCGPA